MDKIDSFAQVREEARKRGGEALVKKVDAAQEREAALTKQFDEMISEAMATEGDADARSLAMIALTEALSTAYARATIKYAEATNIGDGEAMVISIRSVSSNIQDAMADRDATKGDIIGQIKACRAKPKEEK